MIGVVLWSSSDDRKAVFWCEDQGDLAFFHQRDPILSDHGFFDAGDMVQFDVQQDRKLRKANNARLIEHCARTDLPERLRSAGSVDVYIPARRSATVIPFRSLRDPRSETNLVRKA